MRTIQFEDFNSLEATRVFDSGGENLPLNAHLLFKYGENNLKPETNVRFPEWKERIQRASLEGLDNILYISERDEARFLSDNSQDTWATILQKLAKHKEYPTNTVGLVYCESGISILYTVDENSSISLMVFDELAEDIKRGIIRRDPEILSMFPIEVNTNWFKYGMYASAVGFYPFLQLGDYVPDTFSISKLFTGPLLRADLQSVIKNPALIKKLEKEWTHATKHGWFTKNHEKLSGYENIYPEYVESRQLAYDLDRKVEQLIHAERVLLDIVFNPDTETIVFTERMAENLAKKKGTKRDDSLVGITRIKDQTWTKEIIVDHPFEVRGCFVKLHNPNSIGKDQFGNRTLQGVTWRVPFTKHGYHRRPQRDIEFEREGE